MRTKRVVSIHIMVTEINERLESEEKEGKLNLKRAETERSLRKGIKVKKQSLVWTEI